MKLFPRIKVCGITRIGDGQLAAKLGADYLGLITYQKSPRYVTQKLARSIIEAIPPTIQFVLVFVNEPAERVIVTSRRLRCSIVQLHGVYKATDVTVIQKAGLKVIRAFQIGDASDLKAAYTARADFVLLDNKKFGSSNTYGGTGKSFDWNVLKRKATRPRSLILAGGLSVKNFEEALDISSPLALDFNSGVESAPGIKSATKLKRLFAALELRRQSDVK